MAGRDIDADRDGGGERGDWIFSVWLLAIFALIFLGMLVSGR